MKHQDARAFFEKVGISGLAKASEKTPLQNPDYVFREDMLREMAGFWLTGLPAMKLVGHKGDRKSVV